jgi:hypothetical protein
MSSPVGETLLLGSQSKIDLPSVCPVSGKNTNKSKGLSAK